MKQLLELLDIETLDDDLFRAASPSEGRARIFGGQAMAQALVAASRTVDGRTAHSFYCYFLRSGDPERPILLQVERTRDGRSFSSRRVTARQGGKAILDLSVSYQIAESGPEHQLEPLRRRELQGLSFDDEIRGLESSRSGSTRRQAPLPIEVRTVGGLRLGETESVEPRIQSWMRAKAALPAAPELHQAVLAYASDLVLLMSTVYPHPIGWSTPGFQSASLSHAMWFHRPFRADQWLYCEQESPTAAAARAFARAGFFTPEGHLVASCAQEGLMRLRSPTSA